jgi:choline kinase
MKSQAVIYAAGRATRLGPDHAHAPKILVEVGGHSLLEWHVIRLKAAGIQQLHLVTGHARDALVPEMARISQRHDLPIREWFNPDYGEGSVLSMKVSLPVIREVDGPVWLMDGDVFYTPELLRRLAASSHASALLVDFGFVALDEDPVLVPMREGHPFDLVKQWQGEADRVGESVGFFKLSPAHVPLLMSETLRRVTGPGRRDSLDDVLRSLVRMGCFGVEDITGLPWTEIDYPYDLEHARETVLPRVTRMEETGSGRTP